MSALIDLTGQRFGRLRVLSRAPAQPRSGSAWNCLCDCGTAAVRRGMELRRGDTKSCGCYRKEVASGSARSHGMSRSGTYYSWLNMRVRCDDPTNKDYRRYGGRGIRYCAEWVRFEAFLAAMGERPAGLTLDRIDPDGNYEAGNCRWATPAVQARNKSRTTFDGRRVGVTWSAKDKRWRVRITDSAGIRRDLGCFIDYDKAVECLGRYFG